MKEELKRILINEIRQLGIDNSKAFIMKGTPESLHIAWQDMMNILFVMSKYCNKHGYNGDFVIESTTILQSMLDNFEFIPQKLN